MSQQASKWSIQLRKFVDYFETDGEEWDRAAWRDLQRPRLCEHCILSSYFLITVFETYTNAVSCE